MPQPNEPNKAIDDFKVYFEANLLDGDDIHTESKGTMLSAQEVYSVMQDYIAQQSQAAVEAYKDKLLKQFREVKNAGIQAQFEDRNAYIYYDTVKAIIKGEL